ncbi:MAG: hypothetical protein ACRYGF_10520 [Janthinobacterium lividum]
MSTLNFKRINDEQSEVWRDGFVPHQVSTEAVFLVVRQLCSLEVFDQFFKNYPGIGGTTTLENANVDSIANGLEIAGKQ